MFHFKRFDQSHSLCKTQISLKATQVHLLYGWPLYQQDKHLTNLSTVLSTQVLGVKDGLSFQKGLNHKHTESSVLYVSIYCREYIHGQLHKTQILI